MAEALQTQDRDFLLWPEDIQEENIVVNVNDLSGGLVSSIPENRLPDRYSPFLDGVTLHNGRVETDYGIGTELPNTEDPGGVSDTANGYKYFFSVETPERGVENFLLTDKAFFKEQSNNTWSRVQHKDGSSTLTLSGTRNLIPDWTVIPATGWVVVTNGVDAPFRYDGTNVSPLVGLTRTEDGINALFNTFTANRVVHWNNLLIFLSTTEDGTHYGFRLRYSDAGNPNAWSSGVAGFNDILDQHDPIVTAKIIGPYLAIYRRHSIVRCEWVGESTQLLSLEVSLSVDGPPVPTLVAQLYDRHIFVGVHGAYFYLGGLKAYPISDKLRIELIDNIRHANIARATTAVDFDRNIIHIILPTSVNDETVLYSVYLPPGSEDIEPVWTRRRIGGIVNSIGTIRLGSTALRWDELVGSWADQEFRWRAFLPIIDVRDELLLVFYADDEVARYSATSTLSDHRTVAGQPLWRYRTRTHFIGDKDVTVRHFFLIYNSDAPVNVKVFLGLEVFTELDLPDFPAIDRGHGVHKAIRYINRAADSIQFDVSGSGQVEIVGYGFSYTQAGRAVEGAA